MSTNFAIGILFGIYAGLVNGIFLLPMRFVRSWEWENTWVFFTLFSTGILPWVAAFIAVPDVWSIVRSSPFSYFLPAICAGLIWGIAQVMYGLGVAILGIAIGSAVISCTSTMAGVIGPILVYAPERLFTPASFVLLIAVLLILCGIYYYARAGVRKEKEIAGKETVRQVVSGTFRRGLTISLTTGVLGTVFIYGGKSSNELIAAAKAAGASGSTAFYLAYAVTFSSGMLPGLLYAFYKLHRQKTFARFSVRGVCLRNIAIAALMAALWYSGIIMYGMSSEKMGALGPSIAFVLFGGGTILFSNLFGWMAGEWRGAAYATVRGFLAGMTFLILAIIVVAFGVRQPG